MKINWKDDFRALIRANGAEAFVRLASDEIWSCLTQGMALKSIAPRSCNAIEVLLESGLHDSCVLTLFNNVTQACVELYPTSSADVIAAMIESLFVFAPDQLFRQAIGSSIALTDHIKDSAKGELGILEIEHKIIARLAKH